MLCLSGKNILVTEIAFKRYKIVFRPSMNGENLVQEEYTEGEDMGTLECGHEFHSQCIKEWLKQKNLCPICKTTGLNTAKKRRIA